MGQGNLDTEANMVNILVLGFSLFIGQPEWYELDTRGVDWTVSECHVAKDYVCLLLEQEYEGYDALADHITSTEEN